MRYGALVSLLWVVLVVGTDHALAASGLPYPWHLTAALLLYMLVGHWIRVPGWPLLHLNARETLRTTFWAGLVVVAGTAVFLAVAIAASLASHVRGCAGPPCRGSFFVRA